MDEHTDAGRHHGRSSRLADVYERFADDAVRLGYVLTGDRQLAEDLMQEAFVKFARRLGHLRDPDAAGAYLRRTVVNLVNSHFRRRKLERAHLARERSYAQVSSAEPSAPGVDHADLRTALLELPIRQRTAIVLRFLEDLPEREIAEVMGLRVGAVKALVHRGMESLRVSVKE